MSLGLATILGTDGNPTDEACGPIVELLGGFLTDALERFGIGGHEVGNDLLGFDGKVVEAFDAGTVATPPLGGTAILSAA